MKKTQEKTLIMSCELITVLQNEIRKMPKIEKRPK